MANQENTNQENAASARAEKKRKIILVSAVVFVLLAIIALVYNITILATNNAQIRRLEEQIAITEQQIEALQDERYFRNSPEFIEDFARRYFEWHNRGEYLFIAR